MAIVDNTSIRERPIRDMNSSMLRPSFDADTAHDSSTSMPFGTGRFTKANFLIKADTTPKITTDNTSSLV